MGGERKTDQLVRQAGTLFRMATSGLGTLREVALRSTQAGYLRMDVALLHRERREELAALGAEVAALLKDGTLEDLGMSHNLLTNIGRVVWSSWMGGGIVVQN